jgi:uncharacterized membrane protein
MPEKTEKTVEAIVLCIDRDDDLGKKAAVKGPIIGEEENFAAAKSLAMADPEDTDLNAILAAIKVKRESEHLYKGIEVVTITGDRDVGVVSDQKINNQLVRILETYKPKGVILITDGQEDEEVIPLIQNETKILSVKTITVRQARQLESAYFKLQDFFGRIGDNPRQAQMVFGLPGILILLIVLLSYFGVPIVEVIFALIGIYLIAKGFGYDEQLVSGLSEVRGSLLQGNIYKVFNVIGLVLIFFSLIAGYYELKDSLGSMYEPGTIIPGVSEMGIQPATISQALVYYPELSLNFILFSPSGGAINLILVAVCVVATGFVIHNFVRRQYIRIKKFIYVYIAAILVKYMSPSIYWVVLHLKADSNHIVGGADAVGNATAIQNFLIAGLISFVLLLVAHYILKILFFDYIARKKQLEAKYMGKKAVSKDGKRLGEVTKITMVAEELKGINVKKKFYKAEELEIKGDVIVVRT